MACVESEAKALETTRRLGLQLLQTRSHVNNAPLLITILSGSYLPGSTPTVAASSPKCLLEALTSLQAFFLPLLRTGEISFGSTTGTKTDIDDRGRETSENNKNPGEKDELLEKKPVSDEAQAIYRKWLMEKYREFTDTLLNMLSCDHLSTKIRVAALHALMELVRSEYSTKFSNHLYFRLCSRMLSSGGLSSGILAVWDSEYLKYVDVSFYTYSNLQKLLNRRGSDESSEVSTHTFVCNFFDVLSRLPPPENPSKSRPWSKFESGLSNPELSMDSRDGSMEVAGAWKDIKKQRLKFTKAWLAFLQLKLPTEIYKKVLAQLPTRVIPFMTNPILLSDFFTNSYNMGGLVSVMALSGLFILITDHGLEYPDYYTKLYALLEPSIFVAKHRARFFELLDTSLKSSHLPAYLAAAFAKKLGRLGLSASPSGCLVVTAMIHNLLRRHPSVNCLVDGQERVEDNPLAVEGRGTVADPEGNGSAQSPAVLKGADPFVPFETDPSKCLAMRSSLWEIETLRHHYCPAVSRFVASLETDLTVRSKTTEVAIKDFSSGSYATIFSEEVGRRLKQVPLAFYQTIPSSIFPSSSDTGDFVGWTFSGKLDAQNTLAGNVEAPSENLAKGITPDNSGSHPCNYEEGRRSKKNWR